MSSQATIKDVARLAGVSIGTVDRVIHNRGKVSEKNRQAVLEAAQTLHYTPSQVARALVKRRNSLKIGVAISEVESEFWSEALQGIYAVRDKLSPFGVEILIEKTKTYHFTDQKAAIESLIQQSVNGLVFIPIPGKSHQLAECIPPEIPYATVIEDVPDSRRLFHIGPNNYAMGAMAGRLASLYAGNDLKVSILAPNRHFYGTQSRIKGFTEFLSEHCPNGQILEICDVPLDSEETGYQNIAAYVKEQLSHHPELTALYVTNGLTQWAAQALEESCHHIPLVGFERTERTDQYLQNGFITAVICQEPARQWYTAIHLMYDHLSDGTAISQPILQAECRVLIKESLPLMGDHSFYDRSF